MVSQVDRPNFLIRFRGNTDKKVILELRDRILSFTYKDRERGADVCTFTLDNHDLSMFDQPGLDQGNLLDVVWGYPENTSPLRTVIVKRSTGFRQLKVEAYGLEVQLDRETRCRTFSNRKRSDIVREIALSSGFSSDQLEIEDTEVTVETIHQARQTDAQFIQKLAEREGFEFFCDFDGFHFHRRRLEQSPSKVLEYFTDRQGTILSVDSIDANIAAKGGAIRLKGRNSKTKTNIDVRITNATSQRDTLAGVVLVADPESGNSRIIRRNVSERVRSTGQQDAGVVRREAEGRFRKTQLSAVKVKLTVIGDPTLVAKSVVQLGGLGSLYSGKYYISEITHTINSSGYRSKVMLRREGTSQRGATALGSQNTKEPDTREVKTSLRIDPENGNRQLVFTDTAGRVIRRTDG